VKTKTDKDHLNIALKERDYAEMLWQKSLSMFTENPNQDTRNFLVDMMERLNRIDWIILNLGYLIK
jgi:hypothetical protein